MNWREQPAQGEPRRANPRIVGWDERDYKLWSALGVLPSYGRKDRTDHLISLAEVEKLLEKHAEERYDQKKKTTA